MKRIIGAVLMALICIHTLSVFANAPTILYSSDGREIEVSLTDVEAYKNVGWYETKEEVQRTMYAPDGRELVVNLADVEAYKSVGWYETKAEVQRTMYAPDGRELVVKLADVEAYKSVGWYETKAEVQRTMYAPDGRELVVNLADVEAYKNVGWYVNKSDVQRTLYAIDGREITVFYSEVEAYKSVGWYENKSDVQRTLYSADGREITVFYAEVEAYKNVGWYETKPVQSVVISISPDRSIDPSKPMIAITFDDGPKASTTPIVLDVLEKYGVRATFFVQGTAAKSNPNIIKRADSLGCQIGSHTYNHPKLTDASDSEVAYQVNTTDSIISNIIGYAPTTLRPPYGSHNEKVRSIANKPFILWSVDTLDWKHRDAKYVSDYVLSHASDGAIVLLHDIHATTAEAAKTFIPGLINKGYQLVTVEELAYYKGYTLTSGKAYSSFK